MSGLFSRLKLGHLRPPMRRVLALDAGSRCLKLLLAENDFSRWRILKEELINLREEGLVSAEEIKAHLPARLADWGNPPLALVLPQHLTTSQTIDLPSAPESDVEKLIQDETLKLGGVSESRIIYDFVRTETEARGRQQFWVTLSQEADIRERILGLGVEGEDICEVTTTANALIAAYRASRPLSSKAILVHAGAETTVVVIVLAGQGAFATSFQMGGDFFTRALARLKKCPEETAEALKRKTNLLSGPDALPEFVAVVDGWIAELKRQLHEWFEHHAVADMTTFEAITSGGAFDQPGLLEYARTKADLDLRPWPRIGQGDPASPAKGFEVAFGAALQALGYSAQPVSLLPEDYRAAWRKRLTREKIELASLVLLAVCALILALGTWQQLSLIAKKSALLAKVQAGQGAVDANEALTTDLVSGYEGYRPLFYRQQNTLDTLTTLALLQHSRSNRSFWYVLVADQQSYFSAPPTMGTTNRPFRTNILSGSTERWGPFLPGLQTSLIIPTNIIPAKPGLIAELCAPEEPEAARVLLSQLVKDLKQQQLFSKVDLLSDDLRRNLSEPKVILPDKDFVLALDFLRTDFQQTSRPKKSPTGGGSRGGGKRSGTGENLSQTAP